MSLPCWRPPKIGGFSYDLEFYTTQLELIKSQNVALKVIKNLDLEETYSTYFPEEGEDGVLFSQTSIDKFLQTSMDNGKKWIDKILSKGKDEAVASTMTIEEKSEEVNLVELLQEDMTIEAVPASMLINISYRSTNPEFARLVTDTIADAYRDETMAIQLNSTGYALGWMTQKAEEERKRLVESESELQAFMKKHDIITVEDRVAILPQQLSELTTVLSQQRTTPLK
jgi:succinoglycan biosynthesis transport protein ExoP